MKKILTLICTLLCANVLLAQTNFWVGNLQYVVTSINPAKVTVYWYQNNPTTVIIPETVSYNGTTYSVTAINELAFYGCSSLTSITIPNSVTSVGGGVFCECNNLTSVTLSNNITSLPSCYYYSHNYGFFEDCSSLTSVTIPNSVTTIGYHAFYNCI